MRGCKDAIYMPVGRYKYQYFQPNNVTNGCSRINGLFKYLINISITYQ